MSAIANRYNRLTPLLEDSTTMGWRFIVVSVVLPVPDQEFINPPETYYDLTLKYTSVRLDQLQ